MLRKIAPVFLSGVMALTGVISSVNCNQSVVETRQNTGIKMIISWEMLNAELCPRNLEEIAWCVDDVTDYSKKSVYHDLFGNLVDLAKSAKRTVEDRIGDCKDTAVLGAYFAEKIGYEPQILVLIPDGDDKGHAVTYLELKIERGMQDGYLERGALVSPDRSSKYFNDLRSEEDVVRILNEKYIRRKIIKNPYKKHVVINLKDLKCDWREGKENIWPYIREEINRIK